MGRSDRCLRDDDEGDRDRGCPRRREPFGGISTFQGDWITEGTRCQLQTATIVEDGTEMRPLGREGPASTTSRPLPAKVVSPDDNRAFRRLWAEMEQRRHEPVDNKNLSLNSTAAGGTMEFDTRPSDAFVIETTASFDLMPPQEPSPQRTTRPQPRSAAQDGEQAKVHGLLML
jgi:hypothetical protein